MGDPASVGRERASLLWSQSGARWLTDSEVGVPVHVVDAVVALVGRLDRRGAGLSSAWGAGGVGVLAGRAASIGLGPSGIASCGGSTRLLRAADGWIAVSLARPDDVVAVAAWLDLPSPPADASAAWTLVEQVVALRPAAPLVERATLLGLACSAQGEIRDCRRSIAHPMGDAPPASLADVTVANLGSLWAGPLAADVLARSGARVLTVESTSRPDGARATPPFFEALHARSESVALPLHTDTGRRWLRELLERVDVVIEGSRPRALRQMGIDAEAIVQQGPRLWLSITAHGRAEPHAHRIGFGDDAAVAGGLVAEVGGEPRFIADAIADPLTGLVAADVAAGLIEAGGRWLVDVALARVAASIAARADWAPPTGVSSSPVEPAGTGRPLPLGHDTTRVLAERGIA